MSTTSQPIGVELLAYLAQRTTPEDEVLTGLKEAALEAGLPAIWISPEQGSLMRILVRLVDARRVVEVGTLGGYSAIWMARGLPAGGRLTTIEIDPDHAAFARTWIERAGLADTVEVILGAGADVLPTFEAGSIDAVFLDADKGGYAGYVKESLRFLRPGGLIMVDNAFAFGCVLDEAERSAEVEAVRAFNDEMARMTLAGELTGIIVPVGDGCWVGVKS
jgi:predicted O-methyltransferase YrrM